MSVSLERVYRVWDDSIGYFIQVSEDTDGLGMMEISYYEKRGDRIDSVRIPSDMFDLFLAAVKEFVGNNKASSVVREVGILYGESGK